jgi:Tol biopolymer transport system component
MTTSSTPSLITALLLFAATATAQTTERVSVDSAAVQGNQTSQGSALSGDGSLAVFTSYATNLVPGDTNNAADIFVRDRRTGQTIRVSVDSAGAQSNDRSAVYAQISDDGRFVTFGSAATNLVPGDGNGWEDIFVHDLQTSQTTRVSTSTAGVQGNGDSTFPAISADGRYVAFVSNASNLVTGDTNGTADIFVHDRLTGQLARVSLSSAGIQSNGPTMSPSLSANGRWVVYHGSASNLVPGDTNGVSDVFLHDRQTGLTECISVSLAGTPGNGSSIDWYLPSISNDGRFVAFYSLANDLVPGDIGGQQDIFVRDRMVGTTSLISVNSSGAQANQGCYYPSISANGRFVVFESAATNLAPGQADSHFHIFIHDRSHGRTARVSVNDAGTQANSSSFSPAISSDGHQVAYWSRATNLVPGDTNNSEDVFIHDAQLDFGLARAGSCPGPIRLTITNAAQHGWVALLFGTAGSFVKPGMPCQGLTLGVSSPSLHRYLRANASGKVVFTSNVSAAHCGVTLQAVDVATCRVSNTVVL